MKRTVAPAPNLLRAFSPSLAGGDAPVKSTRCLNWLLKRKRLLVPQVRAPLRFVHPLSQRWSRATVAQLSK